MSEEEVATLPLIQVGHIDDPTAITAQISLPAAVWERLTADLRDDDRLSLDRPELPDVPLEVRIWQFLDIEVVSWEASVSEYSICDPDNHGDLEDDLPL